MFAIANLNAQMILEQPAEQLVMRSVVQSVLQIEEPQTQRTPMLRYRTTITGEKVVTELKSEVGVPLQRANRIMQQDGQWQAPTFVGADIAPLSNEITITQQLANGLSWGTVSDLPWGRVFHRFTPAQLAALGVAGGTLNEVRLGAHPDADIWVYVFVGGSWGPASAGTQVYGTPVNTPIFNPANNLGPITYTFTTPIPIPDDQELWIGLWVEHFGGAAAPFVFASGDVNTPFGNIIQHDGGFSTMAATNFWIQGIASPPPVNNDLAVTVPFGLTQIPTSQLVPLVATVANFGEMAQTNIVMSATRNGTDVGATAPLASLAPSASQDMEITPSINPVMGANTVVFTVEQNETDERPENNTATRTFTGTDHTFAFYQGSIDFITPSFENNCFGYAFPITNDAVLNRIEWQTNIGAPGPAAGAPTFSASVYRLDAGTPIHVHTTAVMNRPTAPEATSPWLTVPIAGVDLQQGNSYFVCINQIGTASIRMGAVGAGPVGYRFDGTNLVPLTSQGLIFRVLVDLPPTFVSTYPISNAENVLLDADILVTFNQNVTAGANFGGITISPMVDGFTTDLTGAVLTLTHDGFEEETVYTVTVPAGAIAGFDDPITWSFTTTATSVIVLDQTPDIDATSVAVDTEISVEFNQYIAEGTTFGDIAITYNNGAGTVANVVGVIGAGNTSLLTITYERLNANVTYTVVIPVGAIEGVFGEVNTEPITWSFTTANIRVLSRTPVLRADDVALDAVVSVTFSENITATDLSAITITYEGGTIAVTPSITGAVLTIGHGGFDYETQYRISIPAGAISGVGEVAWSFTTVAEEPPPVTFEVPFFEGFEGTTGINWPEGWTEFGSMPGTVLNWVCAGTMTTFGPNWVPRTGTRQAFIAGPTGFGLPTPIPAADAWMVSPGIYFEAGVAYRLSFGASFFSNTAIPPHLSIHIGQGNTEGAMLAGTEIVRYTDVTTGISVWREFTVDFTVPADGYFNLGFHKFSPGGAWAVIQIDDISIIEVPDNDLMITTVGIPSLTLPAHLPAHQMTGALATADLNVSATVLNHGATAQTNVTLAATLNGAPIGTFAPVASLASVTEHEFTYTATAFTLPTALGAHRIAFAVTQTEEDYDLANNVDTVTVFTVTRDMYRMDELVGATVDFITPAANAQWGHIYTITEATILDRVRFGVRNAGTTWPNIATTWPVTVGIFRVNADNTVETEPIYTQTWTIASESFTMYTNMLDEPIMLTPGRYFVAQMSTVAGTGTAPQRNFLRDFSTRGTMMRTATGTTVAPQAGGASLMSLFLPEETANVATPTQLAVADTGHNSVVITFRSDSAFRVTVFNTETGMHATGMHSAAVADSIVRVTLTGLTPETGYTIRVVNIGGVMDGTRPTQRSAWAQAVVTTRATPPMPIALEEISPAANERNVAVGANVVITFDQEVSLIPVLPAIEFIPLTGSGSPIVGTPSIVGNDLIITPATPFAAGTMYEITIPDSIVRVFATDTSYFYFGQKLSWSFTTAFGAATFADPLNVAVNVTAGNRATLTWRAIDGVPFTAGFEGTTGTAMPAGWLTAGTGWITTGTTVPGVGPITIPMQAGGTRQLARSWQNTGNFAWAFSSGIFMTAGREYTISFWFQAPGFETPQGVVEHDNFALHIGTSRTLSGTGQGAYMPGSTRLFINHNERVMTWTQVTRTFTATETGYHFLGFQCGTASGLGFFIVIDNISVGFEGTAPVQASSFNIFLNETAYGTVTGGTPPTQQFVYRGLAPGYHIAGLQSVGTGGESNIIPVRFYVAPFGIESRTPDVNATNVMLDSEIRVNFVQDSLFAGPGFWAEDFTITPAVDGLEVRLLGGEIIIRHDGLAYETTYTVTIPRNAIVNFDSVLTWTFTTIGYPPLFVSTLPANNATSVATNAQIFVTFNRAIVAGDLESIVIYPALEDATVVAHYNSLIITHYGLAPHTMYTITVPTAAISRFEGETITFSFTTGEVTGIDFGQVEVINAVAIYPNPVVDMLHIETTETVSRIEIFNLQGSLVMVAEGNTTAINVSVLPAGTYVIRIITETGAVATQRFVKR